MISLLLLSLLAQTSETRIVRPERLEGSRESGRTGGAAYAFFEAFPANGAGTSGACSTTAPTGAKGEVLTFTRGSTATCTKTATGGLATTGIANGDLVTMSSGVARQEYDTGGVLGLLIEKAGTNLNLQSANLADAVYANVGAPTVTANTTTAPDNTLTMATIQDNSAAAFEGRSQTITVTAGQPYTLSVFVKAGTLSGVTVSLDGTTATCTSLSATTSTRCIVTDAAASGVAIVASVTGGTVVGDTGTFVAWGQQVELGSFASSYIPTAAGTVTRSAELASFPVTPASVVTGSMSARVQLLTSASNGLLSATATGTFKQSIITFAGELAYVGGVSRVGPLAALTAGQHTIGMWWDGTSTTLILDGTPTSGPAGTPAATNALQIGNYDATTVTDEPGIYSRIKYDLSTTRGL